MNAIKIIENCPECKNYLLKKYLIEYSSIYKFKKLFNPEYRETVILTLVGIIILLFINIILS